MLVLEGGGGGVDLPVVGGGGVDLNVFIKDNQPGGGGFFS